MDNTRVIRIMKNIICKIGLNKDGFMNNYGEINYDRLYKKGIILTYEKSTDKRVRDLFESTYRNITKNENEKKKLDQIRLNEEEEELLIRCKDLFSAIKNFIGMQSVDGSHALWGCAYSFFMYCKKKYEGLLDEYEGEFNERPFTFRQEDEFVKSWKNFMSVIDGKDYNTDYHDYSKMAGDLAEESNGTRKTFLRTIKNLRNANEHYLVSIQAIQGAMICMIKSHDPRNEAEKIAQKKALSELGVFEGAIGDGTQLRDVQPGKLLTINEVNEFTGASVYRGMNYDRRVVLMGKNYADDEVSGEKVIFEGENVEKKKGMEGIDPFSLDQQKTRENYKFCHAVDEFKKGMPASNIRVFHWKRSNGWEYKGIYALIDYKYIFSGRRRVFKFILEKKV